MTYGNARVYGYKAIMGPNEELADVPRCCGCTSYMVEPY